MKKIICILVTVCLALTFFACQKDKTPTKPNTNPGGGDVYQEDIFD